MRRRERLEKDKRETQNIAHVKANRKGPKSGLTACKSRPDKTFARARRLANGGRKVRA